MQKLLRRAAVAATIAMAGIAASPAQAETPPVIDPCSATWVQNGIACVGYYAGNMFQRDPGQATDADTLAAIQKLLAGPITATQGETTPAYNPPYTLDYDTILAANSTSDTSPRLFNILMSGLTIVGIHWGNTDDANVAGAKGKDKNTNVSAIWLVNLGPGTTNAISLANPKGSSTVRIYATSSPVPEPGTWALMLLGFGAVGVGIRRRRRRTTPALLQMA